MPNKKCPNCGKTDFCDACGDCLDCYEGEICDETGDIHRIEQEE